MLAGLTTAGYGTWAVFASLLTLGGVADAGIRIETARRVADAVGAGDDLARQRAVSEGLGALLVVATGAALAGAALGPLLLRFSFPDGATGPSVALAPLLALVIGGVCLSILSGVLFAVLRGVQRPDIEAYGALAGVVVQATVTLGGLAVGLGVWSLAWAALAALGSRIGIQYLAVRRLLPDLRLRPCRPRPGTAGTLATLSALALVTQVPEIIDAQWDKVVLSRYAGSAAVGQFELGSSLSLVARGLALLPLLPLLAALAELRVRDVTARDALFERLSRLSASLGAVVLLGVVVLAPSFFQAWLGKGHTDAAVAARLIAAGLLIGVVGAPWVAWALAERWHVVPATSAATLVLVNTVTSLALTPRYGLPGAAAGTLCANAAGVVVLGVLLHRRARKPWLRPALRPLTVVTTVAAAALTLGADEVTGRLAFLLVAVTFAVVALAALVATRQLRPAELVRLLSPARAGR